MLQDSTLIVPIAPRSALYTNLLGWLRGWSFPRSALIVIHKSARRAKRGAKRKWL